MAALVADSYVHFGAADLLVPYASGWKPGAVALGITAFWALVAVELSSLVMKRLPRRWWKAVHLTSYAAFWLTSLHATFAGTDATQPLYQWTAGLSIALLVLATAYRVLSRRPRPVPRAADTRPAPRAARPRPAPGAAEHGATARQVAGPRATSDR